MEDLLELRLNARTGDIEAKPLHKKRKFNIYHHQKGAILTMVIREDTGPIIVVDDVKKIT